MYILDVLLVDFLGLEYFVTDNKSEAQKYTGPLINYSTLVLEEGIQIVPHGVLSDYGIVDYPIEVRTHPRFEHVFFGNGKGSVPFDLLAASFWLISRYEEYLPFKANKYGVFDYRSSLAWQNGFLQKPLVTIWCKQLFELLKKETPALIIKEKYFRYIPTIDIDSAYQYKYKGFVRSLAGYLKDVSMFNFTALMERTKVITGIKQDQFDGYDFIIACCRKYNVKPILFFLLGDYGTNDKNHPSSDVRFQRLIKKLCDYGIPGLHPSFASNKSARKLMIEKMRLFGITHHEITGSRQHFGMVTFPETYRALIEAGLKEDFSLGYAREHGFRASASQPFYWYDLQREEKTGLLLVPYVLNDASFRNKVTKEQLEQCNSVINYYFNIFQQLGGTLVFVFHSDMLGNTQEGSNFRQIYQENLARLG